MKQIEDQLGCENQLDYFSRAIRDFAKQQQASTVGVMHVTCSDQSERDGVESIQHWIAEDQLPSLKYSVNSPFRTANLGNRYEWGSVAFAHERFADATARSGSQLLLVKINSHVSVIRDGSQFVYGTMNRRDQESPCCGAIDAVFSGGQLPSINDLRESFRSEGLDRISILQDESAVDPHYRKLLAAVTSARLQARRVILDVQNLQPECPTQIVVLPCVTLNRTDRNTEIPIGVYHADLRNSSPDIYYQGLGDNPGKYRVIAQRGMVKIVDDQVQQRREARDHRAMVLSQWQRRQDEVLIDEEHMREIVVLHEQRPSASAAVSKEILKTLLRLLADIALVPTAVLLFADGVVGIHNIYRAYRLANGEGTPHDATAILDEIMTRAEQLSPDQAQKVIALLCQNFDIPMEADDEDLPDLASMPIPTTVDSTPNAALSTTMLPGPSVEQTLSTEVPLTAHTELTVDSDRSTTKTVSGSSVVDVVPPPERPVVDIDVPRIEVFEPKSVEDELIVEAELVEIEDVTPEIDVTDFPSQS